MKSVFRALLGVALLVGCASSRPTYWTNYPKPLDREEAARVRYECHRASLLQSNATVVLSPDPGPATVQTPGPGRLAIYDRSQGFRSAFNTAYALGATRPQVDLALFENCMNAHGYRRVVGEDEAQRIRQLRQPQQQQQPQPTASPIEE